MRGGEDGEGRLEMMAQVAAIPAGGEERIIKNLDLESHCLHLHLSSNTKNSCDYEQILNLSGPELSHH